MRPLHDKVIIEPSPKKTTSESGAIIIPDSARQDVAQWGKVVAVGTGRKDARTGNTIPVDLKPDDTVLFIFRKGAQTEVDVDNRKCLLISEQEVLAVIDANA